MVDSSPVTSAPAAVPRSPRLVKLPPTWHALIFGGVLVGLTVLVILTQEALAPYIVGLILVFLMNGLVDRLQRSGIPRWGGTLIAIFALIVALIVFVWLILDALVEQMGALISSLPEIADTVADWVLGLPLPENVDAAVAGWVETWPTLLPSSWPGFRHLRIRRRWLRCPRDRVGGDPVLHLLRAVGQPGSAQRPARRRPWLVPLLGLRHPQDPRRRLRRLGARNSAHCGDRLRPFVIGFYVFGILIDPDIGAYALLFAATLAVSELIPVIGPILAIIPILAITAVIAGPAGVIAVGLLFIVIEQIDGAVVQPKVQGHALDLHPAIILPALAMGAALAGLMGAVLALPLAAAARQTVAYLLRITDGPLEAGPTAADSADAHVAHS